MRTARLRALEFIICFVILAILYRVQWEYQKKGIDNAREVLGISATSNMCFTKEEAEELRTICRETFCQKTETPHGIALEICPQFAATDEETFAAYWNTVINLEADGPIDMTSEVPGILAHSADGTTVCLLTVEAESKRDAGFFPIRWAYLCEDLDDISGPIKGRILVEYSDGYSQWKIFPAEFPACEQVLALAREYVRQRTSEQKAKADHD
jgi:hypothetical protein